MSAPAAPARVGNNTDPSEPMAANKPKRVRTGCLTCRQRHLKCDEGLPICQNCSKASRTCVYGVRLNFIDTRTEDPPIIPRTKDWKVRFQDESRDIASEYQGGLGRYPSVDQATSPPGRAPLPTGPAINHLGTSSHHALPPLQSAGPSSDGVLSAKQETSGNSFSRDGSIHHSHTASGSSLVGPPAIPFTPYSSAEQAVATSDTPYSTYGTPEHAVGTRDYLKTPDEVLFMQVFVEEVGLWMDSMDPMKHFSRLLPFHALSEPMLLNAFLACGARHLALVNPLYHEEKSFYYYDLATTQLLRSLQNPDRDTVICATAAVILNVYEIMSERAMQRMNHIAGARALIKECGWSARSTGIGAACFWLNVGMELLSCLHFNWKPAWEPERWGVDMNFAERGTGQEEIWVHRMLYIVGKVATFRATIPMYQEATPHKQQARLQARFREWQSLKDLCDSWNSSVPRSMHPMAYLWPQQTSSKSAFPEVWLIKRVAIVGRLFYHTAMCLLPQINPLMPKDTDEMRTLSLAHAHQICGIAAHVKDRGVASVAIRSLAIAAECLVVRREQEEVLEVFEKIRKETGWRVGFLHKELKVKWGWQEDEEHSSLAQFFPTHASDPATSHRAPRAMPSGISNPLLKTADFSHPEHPYQQHYQPPNQNQSLQHQNHLFSLSHM